MDRVRRQSQIMTGDRQRIVLAAFIVEALLAGGNSISVRFVNRELAPLWAAGSRFLLAAAPLLVIMAAARQSIPRGRAFVGVLLFGLLQFAGAFGLYQYALVEMHAGMGQILLALIPLTTLLLAVAQGQERFQLSAAAGTVIVLVGVGLISRLSGRESVPLTSLLAVLGSVLCFSEAAVVVRRFPPVHPVAANAIGMAVSAIVLVGGSLVVGESRMLPQRVETWVALVYLAAAGSAVVFLLHVYVLQHWNASRVAYVMVLIPFIAVALSAWLDDEPISGGLVFGGLLVIAGVYVGALRGASGSPRQSES